MGSSVYDEDTRSRRTSRSNDPRKGSYYRRMRNLVLGVVLAALVVVAVLVVKFSPLFEIERITASPTAHVTSEEISAMAAVPAGSTLFSVDGDAIKKRLSENPWIASVTLSRNLPHTLVIEVRERTSAAIVMLSNGSAAWRIASDGYWLEEVALQESTSDNGVAAPADQARALAGAEGLVYISDVSALVKPEAGTLCTDDAILGVIAYLDGFTGALRGMVVSAKAPSTESISIVLSNGIEVSLGAPEDIELKQQVILELLELYAGQMTYINVREPLYPTWRAISADVAGEAPADGGGPVFDEVTYVAFEDEPVDETADEGTVESDPYAGQLVGTAEGGPGGSLDVGGYYSDAGPWVYAYYDANGNWINGYYEADGSWVQIS